jgi:hypothetical protein
LEGFRFTENPFFIKLCPRLTFEPDSRGLIPGMYLPLDYWKLISVSPTVEGPRGGKLLSYGNVRRYLANTQFAAMASGGWIGTNIYQSQHLETAIRSTLESGRAAIIAVKGEGSG